ncbi:CHASE2 domain-containing protein [Desulfurivibrio dismutans]|uniref:CHASE2 domain-containing protein n=1 Tax=Desulfurivibrio dismutans TaxID=1398908 RepID=UPI0023DB06EF|nr:CHASE2 domain-containing protein [Desulfurivibrio alkaliphilus]MDF1615654.1 CHASE2 domain-containing protein [Desulfurivibrio alkaliphilus]
MARFRSLLRPTPFKIGCLVILAAVAFFYSFGTEKPRLLEALDQRVVDTMFHWRGAVPAGDRVIIVDLDERSLREVGQWPWPRHQVAQMLTNIGAGGAVAIGLDMVFAEPDRTSPATLLHDLADRHPRALADSPLQQLLTAGELDHDQVLGETLAAWPSVLGYVFERRDDGLKDPHQAPFPAARIQLAPPELSFTDLQLIAAYRPILNVPEVSLALSEGFFNVFPDVDGTVRRVPLLMSMDGIPYPSLALELARLGLGEETLTIHAEELTYGERRHALLGVSVGPRYIPTDEQGQLSANFRGPPYTFTYVSAVDALENRRPEIFQNKIVIVGTSAAGLSDLRATPFSEVFPGVEVHATVVDNILAGDPLVHDIYTEIGLTHATVIGGGLLLTFLLVYSGPLAGGLAALGLIIAAVAGNYYFFFLQNQVVGLVYPLATLVLIFMVVTLSNYFFEGRQKRFISKAFSQYVPPELVKEMALRPDDLALGGESREMTVLFSDVRGFTAISENLEATELSRLMNDMLTPLTRIIHQHRGTIDKYMGDAIMAFWGAPLHDADHARHGLQAALDMVAVMPAIREKFQARGWPAIHIGVGLSSGPMNVGNMGSEFRMAYTVMGDAVNLGARLEGLTKLYGVPIVISRHTRDLVPDYACRELDLVRVSGKARPVAIFEPLGPAAELDPATTAALAQYHQALNLYRQGQFTAAAQQFEELHQADPKRLLYCLYRDRCRRFHQHPPPPDWDGVFTHGKGVKS